MERASELLKDTTVLEPELDSFIKDLVKEIEKVNKKGNQAAATRARKKLMTLKKFCDVSRKEIQKSVVEIREERKKASSSDSKDVKVEDSKDVSSSDSKDVSSSDSKDVKDVKDVKVEDSKPSKKKKTKKKVKKK
tara:strand:- start:90 stop:494 length:405 start_codon:yes stop_codon:yes gene_type:complete